VTKKEKKKKKEEGEGGQEGEEGEEKYTERQLYVHVTKTHCSPSQLNRNIHLQCDNQKVSSVERIFKHTVIANARFKQHNEWPTN